MQSPYCPLSGASPLKGDNEYNHISRRIYTKPQKTGIIRDSKVNKAYIPKGKRIHSQTLLLLIKWENLVFLPLTAKLNNYFETVVEIPRIKVGERQKIETLINEEALLFAMCLRNEGSLWTQKIGITN